MSVRGAGRVAVEGRIPLLVGEPDASALATGGPDFFAAVIYELRQPLTALRGQAQLTQQLLATDPLRASQALDDALAQITRVDRVLADLHDRAHGSTARPPR